MGGKALKLGGIWQNSRGAGQEGGGKYREMDAVLVPGCSVMVTGHPGFWPLAITAWPAMRDAVRGARPQGEGSSGADGAGN